MDNVRIKEMAKEQISGKIGVMFVIYIIINAISIFVSFIPALGPMAASILVLPPFVLSISNIFLNIAKEDKKPEIRDAFCGFYDAWSAVKVGFLVSFFVSLWSLLFIIPGIIKSLSYSMSSYILAENKGMNALDAIGKSKQMMEGHKMELFMLQLSFIGWILLTIVTFGIAGIYVYPYMQSAMTNFYLTIKPEYENDDNFYYSDIEM